MRNTSHGQLLWQWDARWQIFVLQGYYVLHANLGLIPKPKDNIYSVREGLCTLFQRWSTAAKLASASGWHSHSELRCSPRLDALLLHTYESSSALQVTVSLGCEIRWLVNDFQKIAKESFLHTQRSARLSCLRCGIETELPPG